MTQSFDVFFDPRLNKRLSKQLRRRWFETPSRSLWRHCNRVAVTWHWWVRSGPQQWPWDRHTLLSTTMMYISPNFNEGFCMYQCGADDFMFVYLSHKYVWVQCQPNCCKIIYITWCIYYLHESILVRLWCLGLEIGKLYRQMSRLYNYSRRMFIGRYLHWNGNVVILMTFSSLLAPEVIKMTTSGAAPNENYIKMIFPLPC